MKPFPIDHDLHCHSGLSLCSGDPGQNKDTILAFAKAHGYTCQCITDHLWDSAVPGASSFYTPQDIAHVSESLPLPEDDSVRMVFGCETEFCGGEKFGLSKENYDKFDFIVIPPNHFHMINFVRPESYNTPELIAELLATRLEELQKFDLPWERVGIAHMTCGLTFREGNTDDVFVAVDEDRYRAAMRFFAGRGTGIEINCASFGEGWDARKDDRLRLYRFAKEEGCRFYLASDAHHPADMACVPERAPAIVAALGLDESNLYRIP